MTALGIVPARGGSKEAPGKNLRLLAGEPLIVHTLRTARQARLLDRLVVSTDDATIAAVAEAEGVEVVVRPPELAADDSPTEDALLHVLDELAGRGEPEPEYVVTLEPTSPLRTARLIDDCVRLALEQGADAVITVAETRENYGRLVGGHFGFLFPGAARRRQDREPLYRESSTVYVTRTSGLRATRSVLADSPLAVIVPADEAVDVNTLLDFTVAEAIMLARTERDG